MLLHDIKNNHLIGTTRRHKPINNLHVPTYQTKSRSTWTLGYPKSCQEHKTRELINLTSCNLLTGNPLKKETLNTGHGGPLPSSPGYMLWALPRKIATMMNLLISVPGLEQSVISANLDDHTRTSPGWHCETALCPAPGLEWVTSCALRALGPE